MQVLWVGMREGGRGAWGGYNPEPMLASAGASTPVFWVLSEGDIIAIGIALLANGVTIWVTRKDRASRAASEKKSEEWRRAQGKHDRVHGHFTRIVFAANVLEAMTGPTQWTADRFKSESELKQLRKTIDRTMQPLADAAASLAIEEITEPVDSINKMVQKFFDFRHRLFLIGEQKEQQSDWDEMNNDAEAIKGLQEQLEKELPAILKKLLPDKPD